jgi:hypothetical protein
MRWTWFGIGFGSNGPLTSDLSENRKLLADSDMGHKMRMTSEFWHDFAEGWEGSAEVIGTALFLIR